MTFAEKLVFLMDITSATNKQLADAANVDPSLISLMRTGRRTPAKNSAYIGKLADYFARRCTGGYQRTALCELIGEELPSDADALPTVLYSWLTDNRDRPAAPHRREAAAGSLTLPATAVYYGERGRSAAVDALFDALLAQPRPGMVYISIDEYFSSVSGEAELRKRISDGIAALLSRGFRIRRIEVPLQSVEKAYASLSLWLPFYLTDRVEPYFYPGLHEELYRRIFIIQPGVAAAASVTTGGSPASRATVFTRDERLVNAFAGDFEELLAKCRPMLSSLSFEEAPLEALRQIVEFESARGASVRQNMGLSYASTPSTLIEALAAGLPHDMAAVLTRELAAARDAFLKSLDGHEVIDILTLATADDIRAGRVPVALSCLTPAAPLYYTPESYCAHLKNILALAGQYSGYRPVITPEEHPAGGIITKDGYGVLLFRRERPLLQFSLSRPYIAEACREYLLNLPRPGFSPMSEHADALYIIKELIAELENA